MGCGDACPHLPARHRLDWDLPDPGTLDDERVRRLRDRIEQLVERLIEEAAGAGTAGSAAVPKGKATPPAKRLNLFER